MAEWRQGTHHHTGNSGVRSHQKSGNRPGSGSISSSSMRHSRLKPPPGSDLPLELLSSPSRGLDDHGSASQNLTQLETQEKFAAFISSSIEKHAEKFGRVCESATTLFPIGLPGQSQPSQYSAKGLKYGSAALQSLQQILLLVRRLREGLVASAREDPFTRRIYIVSVAISILVGDNIQLAASLGRLVQLLETEENDVSITCVELSGLLDIQNTTFTPDLLRSLLLLWISINGGQAHRLGAQQKGSKVGDSQVFWATFSALSKKQSTQVEYALRAHRALVGDSILRFRDVLLQGSANLWHRALLARAVSEKRDIAWKTLVKAYLHAATDGHLFDQSGDIWPNMCGPSDWLERILLIDLEVQPPDVDNERAQLTEETPDSWDDGVDDLEKALQQTQLVDSHIEVRRRRLANTLQHYKLGEDREQVRPAECNNELERWRGRLSKQNNITLIKLR